MNIPTVVLGLTAASLIAVGSPAFAKPCTDDAAVLAAREAAADACDCETATNHGQYVKCVGEVVKARVANGQLPTQCKGAVVSCAARSTCGKPGFVTCCRVDGRGRVKCSIKSSAAKCEAAASSKVITCVGSAASCCDACEGGGSPDGSFVCESSTTTTTHATTSTTEATTTSTTEATTSSTEATTTSTQATTTSTTSPGSPSNAFVDAG